jgi:hypothetical protein
MRWRGVRLHWDNAFLPLNIVLLGTEHSTVNSSFIPFHWIWVREN